MTLRLSHNSTFKYTMIVKAAKFVLLLPLLLLTISPRVDGIDGAVYEVCTSSLFGFEQHPFWPVN
jgi:hypothetical protein